MRFDFRTAYRGRCEALAELATKTTLELTWFSIYTKK
jgi:hypothetical protein